MRLLQTKRENLHKLQLGLVFIYLSFTATGDTHSVYKFLTFAIRHDLQDPWMAAKIGDPVWAGGNPGPFVYPFGMYLLLIPARLVTYWAGFRNENYSPFGAIGINLVLTVSYHLMIVFSERVLKVLTKNRSDEIRRYLILSPTIAVSFFLARQFDILPTTATLLSLYFLLRNKAVHSGLFLALGISLKSYPVFLLLPFILFILREYRNPTKEISKLLFSSLTIPIIGNYLFASEAYVNSVLNNPSLLRIFALNIQLGGNWAPVLVTPVVYFFLAISQTFFWRREVSKLQVLGFTSLNLLIPCIFASPMIMWWTWSIPFITILFLSLPITFPHYLQKRFTMTILFIMGAFNVLVATYDQWSLLTQIAFWWRYPWPLTISPQAILGSIIGESYAELVRVILFSLQWGSGMLVAIIVSFAMFLAGKK